MSMVFYLLLLVSGLPISEETFSNLTNDKQGNGNLYEPTLSGYEIDENQTTDTYDTFTDTNVISSGTDFKLLQEIVEKYSIPILDVIGIASSILSLLAIRTSSLTSSSSVYLTGITSCNLLYIILDLLFLMNNYESVSSSLAFQNIYSYLLAYVFWLTFVIVSANAWIILVFASERLIAISWPLKVHVNANEKRTKMIVMGIFLLSVLANVGQLFRFKVDIQFDPLTNETRHVFRVTEFGIDPFNTTVLYLFYAITSVMIPFPLLAVINIVIIYKVRTARKARSSLEQGTSLTSRASKESQITGLLINSLLAFLFCNAVVASNVITVAMQGQGIFNNLSVALEIRFLIARLVYHLNPILNFLVYVISCESLRLSLKKLLGFPMKAFNATKQT